jgi:hypothetical protein
MPTILRAEKAAANHAPSESPDPRKARNFSRLFNESGYTKRSCPPPGLWSSACGSAPPCPLPL